jgi:hypothetical protein
MFSVLPLPHGFYQDGLADLIRHTIDDMLVEASPRAHTAGEAQGGEWTAGADSPGHLINLAWQVYHADAASYPSWEADQIAALLDLQAGQTR